MEPIQLHHRFIARGRPCFIIAEAGVNHNGCVDLARRMVDAAIAAGADAVKFQTFRADDLAADSAPMAEYQRRRLGGEDSQREMLRKLELSEADHVTLSRYCRRKGILFLSTPFDDASADLLDRLQVPAYKVASGELTNHPFLRRLASRGKPMLVSTGMANLEEVAEAVAVIESAGHPPLVLLHCVSTYPADPREVNLRAMLTLEKAFLRPVGFSDHTRGSEVALAAAALGACVIEKHFTLDRRLPGPDHDSSLEPDELASLIRSVRTVGLALGHGRKVPSPSEADTAAAARKSLVARTWIRAGTVITDDMIAIMRPGTGLPPSMRERIIGRRAAAEIPGGTPLVREMLA